MLLRMIGQIKVSDEVLGVVMMRLVAVAGNSCLTIRSLIVLLTIC